MTDLTPTSDQIRTIDHVTEARTLAVPPYEPPPYEPDVGRNWPSQAPTEIPWHPRITPYRFVVLSTTIGLGTAKAVLTQSGRVVVSITLEWIMGTALSLLLFSISAYDIRGREDAPPYLSFFFKPDCMDIFWNILSSFSVPRPFYVSEERLPLPPGLADSHYQREPISITPYRILVCLTVASFGIFKAMLGYYGLSTAMTWMDWALAVPVTTLLYCLGLYEYNSSNMWPDFFEANLSEFVHSVKTGISYTILISLSAAWTIGCTYLFQPVSDWPSLEIENRKDTAYISLRLMLQDLIVAGIVAGSLSFLLLVRLVLRDVMDRGGLVRRCSRLIRQAILKSLRRIFLSLRHICTREVAHDRGDLPPPSYSDSQVYNIPLRIPRAASPYPPEDHMHDAKLRLALIVFLHLYIHLFSLIMILGLGMFTFTAESLEQSDPSVVVSPKIWEYIFNLLAWFAGLYILAVMIGMMILDVALMVTPFFEKHGQLQDRLKIGLGPFKYLL